MELLNLKSISIHCNNGLEVSDLLIFRLLITRDFQTGLIDIQNVHLKIISQTDKYLVILSTKRMFYRQMTKY